MRLQRIDACGDDLHAASAHDDRRDDRTQALWRLRPLHRRLRQAKHFVKRPGKPHRVNKEKRQQGQIGQKGREEARAQPISHHRHQQHREPAFKARAMGQAPRQAAPFNELARFPFFKHGVKNIIPTQRNARQHHRQQQRRSLRLVKRPPQHRPHKGNGKHFIQKSLKHTAAGRGHASEHKLRAGCAFNHYKIHSALRCIYAG